MVGIFLGDGELDMAGQGIAAVFVGGTQVWPTEAPPFEFPWLQPNPDQNLSAWQVYDLGTNTVPPTGVVQVTAFEQGLSNFGGIPQTAGGQIRPLPSDPNAAAYAFPVKTFNKYAWSAQGYGVGQENSPNVYLNFVQEDGVVLGTSINIPYTDWTYISGEFIAKADATCYIGTRHDNPFTDDTTMNFRYASVDIVPGIYYPMPMDESEWGLTGLADSKQNDGATGGLEVDGPGNYPWGACQLVPVELEVGTTYATSIGRFAGSNTTGYWGYKIGTTFDGNEVHEFSQPGAGGPWDTFLCTATPIYLTVQAVGDGFVTASPIIFGDISFVPQVDTGKYMLGNGNRYAVLPAPVVGATAGDSFVLSMTVIVLDGPTFRNNGFMGADNTGSYILGANDNGAAMTINFGGDEGDAVDIFVGMTIGSPATFTVTRIGGIQNMDWTCTQGAITTQGTMNVADRTWLVSEVYAISDSGANTMKLGAGMWDFVIDNTTSGQHIDIPLDEGSGLESIAYVNGAPAHTFTWTSADWGDKPT